MEPSATGAVVDRAAEAVEQPAALSRHAPLPALYVHSASKRKLAHIKPTRQRSAALLERALSTPGLLTSVRSLQSRELDYDGAQRSSMTPRHLLPSRKVFAESTREWQVTMTASDHVEATSRGGRGPSPGPGPGGA
jgi:hypothetical protein